MDRSQKKFGPCDKNVPNLLEKRQSYILSYYYIVKLHCVSIQRFVECFMTMLCKVYQEYQCHMTSKLKLKPNDQLQSKHVKWIIKKMVVPLEDSADAFVKMYKKELSNNLPVHVQRLQL